MKPHKKLNAWIKSFELEFIKKEELDLLIEKLDTIGKLIYGLIKSIENKN
jgi:hypothetical protein